MAERDQGVEQSRYALIPRTAVFVRQGDSYLLIKGAPTKRLWANKYNGVGGHVDRGEDVLSCAARELMEETGLEADLWLCGTVIVDAGEVGVGLYVFSGEMTGGVLRSSVEGMPEWVSYQDLASLPTVEDLPALLQRIHGMRRGDPAFSARSFYDKDGRLRVLFGR